MRIIIVGQGPFSEKVLEALIQKGQEIAGTFSPPDKRGEGMKTLAEKSGIAFFRPNLMRDPEVYDAYVRLQPELAMLAFVTDIIPEKLLTVPSLGTICYHPSLFTRDIVVRLRLTGRLSGAIRGQVSPFSGLTKGSIQGPFYYKKRLRLVRMIRRVLFILMLSFLWEWMAWWRRLN